jgi:hypothetical protein
VNAFLLSGREQLRSKNKRRDADGSSTPSVARRNADRSRVLQSEPIDPVESPVTSPAGLTATGLQIVRSRRE